MREPRLRRRALRRRARRRTNKRVAASPSSTPRGCCTASRWTHATTSPKPCEPTPTLCSTAPAETFRATLARWGVHRGGVRPRWAAIRCAVCGGQQTALSTQEQLLTVVVRVPMLPADFRSRTGRAKLCAESCASPCRKASDHPRAVELPGAWSAPAPGTLALRRHPEAQVSGGHQDLGPAASRFGSSCRCRNSRAASSATSVSTRTS